MSRSPHRLLTQLGLASGLVMITAFVSFGWLQSHNQSSIYLSATLDQSLMTTKLIAGRSAHYFIMQDYAGLDEFLLSSATLPNINEIVAVEIDGTAISRVFHGKDGKLRVVTPSSGHDYVTFKEAPPPAFSNSSKLVIWKPIGTYIQVGWLMISYDTSFLGMMRSSIWKQTAVMTLMWLAASILILLAALRGQTKSIERLSVFARDLEKNKGKHIFLPKSTLEINNLADSLNTASTELYDAEKSMRTSLLEKEAMLREINHRVKNNMSIINSILRLQSRKIKDDSLKGIFTDCQHRIIAMSLVHEKLYRSNNLANINVAEYTNDLIRLLMRSYTLGDKLVNLVLDIDSPPLNIDTMVPYGMILNELVSNSLKYAFHGIDRPEIRVSFNLVDETILFDYSDNGPGLPESFDVSKQDTLGLQLVHMLAGQMHSPVKISNENGLSFSFSLKFHPDSAIY